MSYSIFIIDVDTPEDNCDFLNIFSTTSSNILKRIMRTNTDYIINNPNKPYSEVRNYMKKIIYSKYDIPHDGNAYIRLIGKKYVEEFNNKRVKKSGEHTIEETLKNEISNALEDEFNSSIILIGNGVESSKMVSSICNLFNNTGTPIESKRVKLIYYEDEDEDDKKLLAKFNLLPFTINSILDEETLSPTLHNVITQYYIVTTTDCENGIKNFHKNIIYSSFSLGYLNANGEWIMPENMKNSYLRFFFNQGDNTLPMAPTDYGFIEAIYNRRDQGQVNNTHQGQVNKVDRIVAWNLKKQHFYIYHGTNKEDPKLALVALLLTNSTNSFDIFRDKEKFNGRKRQKSSSQGQKPLLQGKPPLLSQGGRRRYRMLNRTKRRKQKNRKTHRK